MNSSPDVSIDRTVGRPSVPGIQVLKKGVRSRRLRLLATQLTIIVAVLLAWQYLPEVSALKNRTHLLDRFFISSPSQIGSELYNLALGRGGEPSIWHYLWPTLEASFIGVAIGMTLGALLGLILSNWKFLSDVFHPFVIAMNAVPRIALIPVIIVLVGPSLKAGITICVLVVLFVAFFSAYEGGRTVSPELLQNASILGATRMQVMIHIRLPFVLAWTLAVLPLGMTFGIISVVTAEILAGYGGLGVLIQNASATANATLTFAVVVVLSIVGVCVTALSNLVTARVLHWWGK